MTARKGARRPDPYAGTVESEHGYERYWDRPGRDEQKLMFNGATTYLFGRRRSADQVRRGVEWLKRCARQGDALAAFNLGYAYETGSGLTRNLSQARRWYDVAYGGGFLRAKSFLAHLLSGSRSTEDQQRGARLDRELADAGHVICAYNTGLAFEFARGVRKNLRRAQGYYLQAARKGDVDAQLALGFWALNPDLALRGRRQDLDLAEKWYRLAARSGEPMAKRSLAKIAALRRSALAATAPRNAARPRRR